MAGDPETMVRSADYSPENAAVRKFDTEDSLMLPMTSSQNEQEFDRD